MTAEPVGHLYAEIIRQRSSQNPELMDTLTSITYAAQPVRYPHDTTSNEVWEDG
jgi:hypothetical protein